MKAVVHIGIPKTGSTTIQRFLAANAAALRACGMAYAPCSAASTAQPEYLVITMDRMGRLLDDATLRTRFGISDARQQSAWVAAAERRIAKTMADSGCDLWLISCEMLGWPQREEAFFRTFHDWAAERFSEIRYIVYLRSQDLWLCSEYSQQIKNGTTETLADLIQRIGPPDYDTFLAIWERIAGASHLAVRLYDPAAMAGHDLIQDFCDAAGIAPGLAGPPESLNPQLSMRQADLVLRLNQWVARYFGASRRADLVRRVLREIVLRMIPRGAQRLALDSATLSTVRSRVHASNEAVRRRRFPTRDALFDTLKPGWQPAGHSQTHPHTNLKESR